MGDTRSVVAMPVLAAMLLVCGGGSAVAEGAEAEEGEATQPVKPALVAGRRLQEASKRKLNWGAANLLPSWNNTAPVAATAKLRSLTAEQAAARKATFERLRAAHAAAEGPKAALHNISAESITVLGERNGFTYGVWKGGTGGTMPIRLHLGPNEESWPESAKASGKFKATLRRSAKIWSKRLVDDGQRNDVKLEGGRTLKDVRGIVVQLLLNDRNRNSAGIRGYNRGEDGKLRPYSGIVRISKHLHDNLHDGMAQTIAHEIGHVLGMVTTVTKLFTNYYDYDSHTWNGPNSKRAYGGKPVPMQWVSENKWWEVKEPHAEGARRDQGHIGVCTALMAYCADRYNGSVPSELDFGWLADIGFTLLDPKAAAETERYGYAAWGDWAAYGVAVERDLQDNFYENPHDFTQAYADAFGAAPGMPLTDNSSLSGKAVWKGNLLGVDLGRSRLPPVVGKAKLSVDLATLTGHVRFSGLTVHLGSSSSQSIRSETFRSPSLRYGIDVTGNNFADANSRVQGSFYGPAHQEMAGVVNDTRPEVNLLAGFGGAR